MTSLILAQRNGFFRAQRFVSQIVGQSFASLGAAKNRTSPFTYIQAIKS